MVKLIKFLLVCWKAYKEYRRKPKRARKIIKQTLREAKKLEREVKRRRNLH